MITTAEWDDAEDQIFALEITDEPKTTPRVIDPMQQASTPGITPLKVVLVGLILDGSMPILHTVSR